MSLLDGALLAAARTLPVCLVFAAAPAFADVGEPAGDALVLEARVAHVSEAHSVSLGLSAGGRPHLVWLRESAYAGPLSLVRRYHRPPMSPGLWVEDPVTQDISGPPLMASSRWAQGGSTLAYPDLSGSWVVLRYSAEGHATGPELRPLQDFAAPVLHPALATDADGFHSALVWSSPEPEGFGVYVLPLLPWGSPTTPIRLGSAASIEAPQPRVAYLAPQRFVVSWAQVDAATPFLRNVLMQSLDSMGNLMDSVQEVSSGAVESQGHPDIAGSGWGRVAIAFETQQQIRVHNFDSGLNSSGYVDHHWFAPQWPSAPPRQVRIAADSGQTFVLAWADRDPYSWPPREWIEGLWVDAMGLPVTPVNRFHETEDKPLVLNSIAADADADLWLGWTEGESADQNRAAMARVIRGQSFVDLQVEAEPPAGPVEAGAQTFLRVRLHNYNAPTYVEGQGSASGLQFKVEGLSGAQFELAQFPPGFECEQTSDQLVCTYHGELEPNSVIPMWLPLQTPQSSAPLDLQLSVAGHQTDFNPANNRVELRIERPDTDPNPFAFTPATGVEPASMVTSSMIVVSGINGATAVRVVGGEYSVNGGPFQSADGFAYDGDSLRVRHLAAAGFEQSTSTLLNLGTATGSFTSTTRAADLTPDSFGFAARSGVARGSVQISQQALLSGFEAPLSISVTGGEYRINSGAWTAVAGQVAAGSVIELRHSAASGFSTTVRTDVSVGGVLASFESTTETADAVPDAPNFAAANGVATGVELTSSEAVLGGFNVPLTLQVSGGSYSLNGGPFIAGSSQVSAGDRLRLRHTSAASANTAVSTSVTFGGVSALFSSTTGAVDTTPNAFSFTDVTKAKRARAISSNTLTLSGFNAAVPVSIIGGEYSRNGGAWTAAAGVLTPGQTLRVRLTSSSAANTTTSLTITVGGVSDVWSVTTEG